MMAQSICNGVNLICPYQYIRLVGSHLHDNSMRCQIHLHGTGVPCMQKAFMLSDSTVLFLRGRVQLLADLPAPLLCIISWEWE